MRRNVTISPEKLRGSLLDSLSIDRTMMANERTGLAFIRTSLGLVLSGMALFRFFERQKHDIYELTGILAIVGAVVLAAVGIRNFRHNVREYKRLYGLEGSHR